MRGSLREFGFGRVTHPTANCGTGWPLCVACVHTHPRAIAALGDSRVRVCTLHPRANCGPGWLTCSTCGILVTQGPRRHWVDSCCVSVEVFQPVNNVSRVICGHARGAGSASGGGVQSSRGDSLSTLYLPWSSPLDPGVCGCVVLHDRGTEFVGEVQCLLSRVCHE